jgi:hypothetical protein
MKLFWMFLILTVLSVSWYTLYSKGFDLIAFFLLLDLMALWYYTERNRPNQGNLLFDKILILEKSTSDMFEKLGKRFSKKSDNREDIVEWLDKF